MPAARPKRLASAAATSRAIRGHHKRSPPGRWRRSPRTPRSTGAERAYTSVLTDQSISERSLGSTRMSAVATDQDRLHLRRALELAERGRGGVSPNPLVGALLVRDGEAIGEGIHAE